MIAMAVTSALYSLIFVQLPTQDISLTIENNEIKIRPDILRAECEARGIRVVERDEGDGFQVSIRKRGPDDLEIEIIDRDGGTSQRLLQFDSKAPNDRASSEREIALIIESVIRRWERRKATQEPKTPVDSSGAEPRRKPEPRPPLAPAPEAGWLGILLNDATITSRGLVGASGGLDAQGALAGGMLSLGISYGGRLTLGTDLRVASTDVRVDTPELIDTSGTLADWAIALCTSLQVTPKSQNLRLRATLTIGNQYLDTDGGFEGSGLYSAVGAGVAYYLPLYEGITKLNLVAQAAGGYTWIGATFVNGPNLEAYRPSRIALDAQLGLAWQIGL